MVIDDGIVSYDIAVVFIIIEGVVNVVEVGNLTSLFHAGRNNTGPICNGICSSIQDDGSGIENRRCSSSLNCGHPEAPNQIDSDRPTGFEREERQNEFERE
jgi:hypothetical protein